MGNIVGKRVDIKRFFTAVSPFHRFRFISYAKSNELSGFPMVVYTKLFPLIRVLSSQSGWIEFGTVCCKKKTSGVLDVLDFILLNLPIIASEVIHFLKYVDIISRNIWIYSCGHILQYGQASRVG